MSDSNFSINSRIFCFGEVLFDVFPDQKIPGGAPLNVALHLAQLGDKAELLSRVGEDQNGVDLVKFINGYSLSEKLIQKDRNQPTGVVAVDISDEQDVNYTIEEPAAWDYIQYDAKIAAQLRKTDLFVFGSLGARNDVSFQSLMEYLKTEVFKVMDVNLRPPFYNLSKLEALVKRSDLLKINENELDFFAKAYQQTGIDQTTDFLLNKFELKGVLVTKGENGAYANFGTEKQNVDGVKVNIIVDTVGSGDAFLAGFLSQFIKKKRLDYCLYFGCVMGAFVAGKKGANPKYSHKEINDFLSL